MKNYGSKQGKYHLSIYLTEAQNHFINECCEKYGMKKTEVATRLMFANGTERDPRFYNRVR